MADSYCDDADLYAHGLPRGAAPNPGRLCRPANATANTITLDVHGFAADDEISFRAEGGGALPGGLSEGVTYYALPVSESVFAVAATAGGGAIDLSSAGSRYLVIAPLQTASAREWASRLIDDFLTGHPVPLSLPVPPIVRMTCAELAAGKLLGLSGGQSKSLAAIADDARKRIERWAKSGMPIRGENAPTPAQKAASASVPYSDPRGWNRWGGL